MKCQNLFSGKNKKNIINSLSAELIQRVVKVNDPVRDQSNSINLISHCSALNSVCTKQLSDQNLCPELYG